MHDVDERLDAESAAADRRQMRVAVATSAVAIAVVVMGSVLVVLGSR